MVIESSPMSLPMMGFGIIFVLSGDQTTGNGRFIKMGYSKMGELAWQIIHLFQVPYGFLNVGMSDKELELSCD